MKFNGDAKTVSLVPKRAMNLATMYIEAFKQYADDVGFALGDGIQIADIGTVVSIAVKVVEDARNIHMLKGAEKKALAIALIKKVIEVYGLREIWETAKFSVWESLRRIIKTNGIFGSLIGFLLTQKRWEAIINAGISLIVEYVLTILKSYNFSLKALIKNK